MDCNSAARILLTIVEIPLDGYFDHLIEAKSLAGLTEWLAQTPPAEGVRRLQRIVETRSNPTFGRDAGPLSLELDVDANGVAHLQFDGDDLLSQTRSFWMVSACLCGVLNLNALVCDVDGRVIASNFSEYDAPFDAVIRLEECFNLRACERIRSLLRGGARKELIWTLPNVMFTPSSNKVYAGELVLFPLRVQGVLRKVLMIFREHSRPQNELGSNTISVNSFVAAIENASESIAILDEGGHFIYHNRSHSRMFGIDESERMIGSHWSVIYDDATRAFVFHTAWATLVREGAWQGTVAATRRDGSVFHQMISARRLPGIGYIGTSVDVTDRKRMADKLQTSESQLSAVVQTANDAILTLDADGRILHWNRGAERLFGFSTEEMLDRDIAQLLPDEPEPGMVNLRERLFRRQRNGHHDTVETIMCSADGQRIAVEASLSEWYSTFGREYRTLIVRDIRERLRHLRELVETTDQLTRLKTQKQVYGEIIGFASNIIAIGAERIADVLNCFGGAAALDRCALYQIVDDETAPALQRMADYCGSEMAPRVALSKADLDEISSRHRMPIALGVPSALREKLAQDGRGIVFFDTLSTAGDHGHYLLWCETRQPGVERALLMLELALLKLSACLENHARIEAAARRSALENIGQVAASLVHENNHLASIVSSNLDLLQRELEPQQSHELIEDIQVAMKHHQELFTRLLGAVRQNEYAGELISPEEIIARSLKLMRSSLPSTIHVHAEHHGLPCLLHVDAAMFGSALFNILINAYHACGAHGVIDVSTRTHDRWYDIGITDNGCGIAPDLLRRVTDPFYTTKRGGRGSGLGLFMVKNFCTQSGGELLIESQVGHGTSVTLRLPVATDDGPGLQTQLRL